MIHFDGPIFHSSYLEAILALLDIFGSLHCTCLDHHQIGNRNMFLSFSAIGTSFCHRLGTRTCTVKTKKR